MRLATILSLIAACLAGCQALPTEAELAAQPHARLAGTHVDVSDDRVDTFRVVEIDGRSVLPVTDQPARLIGVDQANVVAAGRPVRVEIEALADYRNTLRRLAWSPMRSAGSVEFTPVAGASYVVRGTVAPELSEVWIEDLDSHAIVSRKVGTPGRTTSPNFH